LGPPQLATAGKLTLSFKPQAIRGTCVMSNLGKKFPNRKKGEKEQHKSRRDEAPEDALWRHVIMQAIADATTPLTETQMNNTAQRLVRQRAREWFEQQSRDFKLVCELAGLEHDRVHRFAMDKIKASIEAQQRATMDNIKAKVTNAIVQANVQTAEFLTSTMPGVVRNFQMEGQDRPTSVTRDCEKIGFSSQNENVAQTQALSAETSRETVITINVELKP
jgi:hypothetical protein